ncbi:hypothetical protein AOE01nite_27090 [Acetobacter oeni]|uniref:Uncharacterized protein n=1 Tax=Acetobacter oeni TaxID=304077 RepID=A0A511XNH2_9PROT|nr:hypothetical protein [Acetobacter oeni]MBB3884337.1 hypothetical protein [Acetobacter oeni]GBR05249.1 hypothetical protein AA21952_1670 [Acetobacter oeni LMG 21952]GEN64485.1 hypothetical protein AOE01nite_27090 [Acetobacter oeni]
MTIFVVVYVLVFGSGLGILVRALGREPEEGERNADPSQASDILATRMHPAVVDASASKGA